MVLVLSDAMLHPDVHIIDAGRTIAHGDDRIGAAADVRAGQIPLPHAIYERVVGGKGQALPGTDGIGAFEGFISQVGVYLGEVEVVVGGKSSGRTDRQYRKTGHDFHRVSKDADCYHCVIGISDEAVRHFVPFARCACHQGVHFKLRIQYHHGAGEGDVRGRLHDKIVREEDAKMGNLR